MLKNFDLFHNMKNTSNAKKIMVSFKNFSNFITLSRVFLSPVVCFCLMRGDYLTSLFVFLIASFTDFFDGFFARKNNQVTDFGKILDPISDKILTFSVMSCFVKMEFINIWAFIIFLLRDFVMSTVRIILSKQQRMCGANMMGKIKTFLQMIFISVVLCSQELNKFGFFIPKMLCSTLLWSSVFFSILSMFYYIYQNKDVLHEELSRE